MIGIELELAMVGESLGPSLTMQRARRHDEEEEILQAHGFALSMQEWNRDPWIRTSRTVLCDASELCWRPPHPMVLFISSNVSTTQRHLGH
jgi:hypothetical protein